MTTDRQPATNYEPPSTGHRLLATGHWLLTWVQGTTRRFRAHDCPLLAAGLAFYTILSLFPLLLGLTAIFGPLLEGTDLQQQLIASVGNAFPGSTDLIIRTFTEAAGGQRTIGAVSLVTLIWSASQIFVGIRRALDRAWGVTYTRPFVHRRLLEAAMLGSVVLLVLASWTAVSLFSVVRPLLPAALAVPGSGPVAAAIAALTSFALSLGAFALLYRFVPKANVTWSDIRFGALLAAHPVRGEQICLHLVSDQLCALLADLRLARHHHRLPDVVLSLRAHPAPRRRADRRIRPPPPAVATSY